jgi:hypothetical protein
VAYPNDALRALKTGHERWVADRLRDGRLPKTTITPLPEKVELDLLASGRQLLELVDGPHDNRFDHDEPRDDDEAELIARTMDALNDWGMIVGDLGPGERLRVARELQSLLVDELLPAGLVIYGGASGALAAHPNNLRTTVVWDGTRERQRPIWNRPFSRYFILRRR